MQVARSISSELRVFVRNLQILHAVETISCVVPVIRVAHGENVQAGNPFLQNEGAVRNHHAGLGKLLWMRRERGPMHGARARMREQARQVRHRRRELNDESAVVRRRDAQLIALHLAADDFRGVPDDVDDLRVLRGGGRIDETPQRDNEVQRNDLVAVRPARVIAQRERIGFAVGTDAPFLRHAWRGARVFRECGEAFAQVAQHGLRFHRAGALRIQ